jgi:hypothetical protein
MRRVFGANHTHRFIFPVQFSQQLQHFVYRLFDENIMQKVLNEGLHWRQLDDFASNSFGRVALMVLALRTRTRKGAHHIEGILQSDNLPLIEVLRTHLSAHELNLSRCQCARTLIL